ncbi:MAG: hypothetical protein PVJ02_07910 [Gemmatimonadota bacterium]|jgi:hypothetical protein
MNRLRFRFRGEWIAQAIVESVFVVVSILLALAVDEWRENRSYEELADQSLGIFEREIRLNQARLEDAVPFHTGIRDLLGQAVDNAAATLDLRGIMEGVETPVILNTAWETALATGALTHMDVEMVSALSLTYSIQDRFAVGSGRDRPRLSERDGLPERVWREQLREAYDYMTATTRGETELLTVYDQALALIRQRRAERGDTATPDTAVSPRDRAHP